MNNDHWISKLESSPDEAISGILQFHAGTAQCAIPELAKFLNSSHNHHELCAQEAAAKTIVQFGPTKNSIRL